MSRETDFGRITKGAVAGLVAGLVSSWAANQFHSFWSKLRGGAQHPEVARLSDRGGRPDTAAAKENVASARPSEEDATVAIASKVSTPVLDRPLTKKEKHQAGLSQPPWRYPFRMHAYSFISHLIYGAVTEQTRKTLRSVR